MSTQNPLPIQPVEKPILCRPYDEPNDHWIYNEDGLPYRAGRRREAGYYYKTERTGSAQQYLPGLTQEQFDSLPLVNLLRADVRRWREASYRGASNVTKDLLRHWGRADRPRRLFFCQREAVETIIYLAELRLPGKSSRTGFQKFELSDDDLQHLLRGERPSFAVASSDFSQTLIDWPFDESLLPLRRLGCKMATGSGKTVVMAMLIAWAFCNRGQHPLSAEFPNAALVCCPNLTVKERLQVLRPEHPENYYVAFDLVPLKYRPLIQAGKVLVTNWHTFAPESEHREGDRNYAVVNKGPETPDTFARRVLGDLYDRLPIMVLNDEGHHCWRPAPLTNAEELSGEERRELEQEAQEATIWIEGLDGLNNALAEQKKPGVTMCVDLSATPFYIKGSGYPEGRPFPWLVSDFGLVDAIESGIVKIPRLPVQDTTGRPEPKYFRLWSAIREDLKPAEFLPGKAKRPKPEAVYREAEGALQQIAGQWVERFKYIEQATPGQERVPPVLIVVCDNTDLAEIFYRKISGEMEEEIITPAAVEAALDAGDDAGESERGNRNGAKNPKKKIVYGQSFVSHYFKNTLTEKRTIRIDTKLLAQAESDDPNTRKQEWAEALRRIVATVGKLGQPGEHVRCVVSVAMLTEGWDANNVTHILGVRAFGSQLLCEQVVGRGLRRMDYTPDPQTGLLTEEYVDVYGIPFSVIPFKGRPTQSKAPEDRPKQHVRALPERARMELRFPNVEGYVFALRKNLIYCDVAKMEPLTLEVNREPTAAFLRPTVGYYEGNVAQSGSPFSLVAQNRDAYYQERHIQTIKFEIARTIVEQLTGDEALLTQGQRKVKLLLSRHQLFPQGYRYVDEYVANKVNFNGGHPSESGLEKYRTLLVERIRDAIEPDEVAGELPLLPLLYRYQSIGTTADVDFKTPRPCFATQRSHINQVVQDTARWESSAAFKLEQSQGVSFYARNDHLGLLIPYEYQHLDHTYEPDFIVRLVNDLTLILEIKGFEDDLTKAKHNAARRWVSAVNNWGQLGRWAFHVCRNPQILDKELTDLL